MIREADVLVLLDDVQYTRRDWRNRNIIDLNGSPKWLTVPVATSGQYHSKIHEIEVSDPSWWRSHVSILDAAYGHCSPWGNVRSGFVSVLEELDGNTNLSVINRSLIMWAMSLLGINTKVTDSRAYPSDLTKSSRLIDICKRIGAAEYISGPAARNYMDMEEVQSQSVSVTWIDYHRLPPISQESFPELSIIHWMATVGIETATRLSTFGESGSQ
jgi:hypothetical protein